MNLMTKILTYICKISSLRYSWQPCNLAWFSVRSTTVYFAEKNDVAVKIVSFKYLTRLTAMKWRDQKPNYKPMKSIQIQRSRRASNEGQKNSKKSKKQSKFKVKPSKKTSCFVLLAVYVIYLVLGAVVFQALEHPNEVGYRRYHIGFPVGKSW